MLPKTGPPPSAEELAARQKAALETARKRRTALQARHARQEAAQLASRGLVARVSCPPGPGESESTATGHSKNVPSHSSPITVVARAPKAAVQAKRSRGRVLRATASRKTAAVTTEELRGRLRALS